MQENIFQPEDQASGVELAEHSCKPYDAHKGTPPSLTRPNKYETELKSSQGIFSRPVLWPKKYCTEPRKACNGSSPGLLYGQKSIVLSPERLAMDLLQACFMAKKVLY